jgi:N-acetylglucosaminyldiphosphoundecaprenol N-acetyl-beta-D-mannosaminyltransferase
MTRANLLGVRVTAFDLATAVAEMQQAIGDGRKTYACTCPVYTLMQAHERPEVRAALNGADWVTPDGVPVVWALRWLGARGVGRVYGPDLMLALSEAGARESVAQFYLGGAPGVAEELARILANRFAGLPMAGWYSPPYRDLTPTEEDDLVARLNRSGARVIRVGLGSPKQDLWMARYRSRLEAPLLVGVGAAFDFFTGRQRQAPVWMQRSGLEWAYRLVQQPRRLWRRYLIYNPKFALLLAAQLAGLRHYD